MIKEIFKKLQKESYEVEVIYFEKDNNTIITIGFNSAHITLYFKNVKPEHCCSLGYVEIDGKHYGIYLHSINLVVELANITQFRAKLSVNRDFSIDDYFSKQEVEELIKDKVMY